MAEDSLDTNGVQRWVRLSARNKQSPGNQKQNMQIGKERTKNDTFLHSSDWYSGSSLIYDRMINLLMLLKRHLFPQGYNQGSFITGNYVCCISSNSKCLRAEVGHSFAGLEVSHMDTIVKGDLYIYINGRI